MSNEGMRGDTGGVGGRGGGQLVMYSGANKLCLKSSSRGFF